MSATTTAVHQMETKVGEPKIHLPASENLEFKAQFWFGAKVLLAIAAVVAATQATSALMIYVSPFWAHWF